MVNISSQFVSLLKELQNPRPSANLVLTDKAGLLEGVLPGDELKALVVAKLSDLYLLQMDNQLIRAKTHLPLEIGDNLRLKVMDNNTPATVRILERQAQQPQVQAGAGAKTFMALKSVLFNVSPQIESLLENISRKSVSLSNLPEGLQQAVSALNSLAQADTPQPDKIRALFSLFALNAPATPSSDAASTPTIFMQMLQEGLNALQERLPLPETSFTQPTNITPSGSQADQGPLLPPVSTQPSAMTPFATADPSDSRGQGPQVAQVQGSLNFGESGVPQAPLVAASDAQPTKKAVSGGEPNAAAVETGVKTGTLPPDQPAAGARPANPVAADALVSGRVLTQAQAESKAADLAVRPVWLYEPTPAQGKESQQAVFNQSMSKNVSVPFQNPQTNIPSEVPAFAGARQFTPQPSGQVEIQMQGKAQGPVQGQSQAAEAPVTPSASSPETQMTVGARPQAVDGLAQSQNGQSTHVRQAMDVVMNQAVKVAETGSPESVHGQQPPSFKDVQGVQPEIHGQVQAQPQAVSSHTTRPVPQEAMPGVEFKGATDGTTDKQALESVQVTAHGQEMDIRAALHTLNALAQHMDRMQAFRLELQQQTGMNFWLVPLWFQGSAGSGHLIWWQDREEERKNGDSRDSRGYNLLFDLQLSRLGSLKIRLSCSGKTVQCAVAAEKEVLPVIRDGLPELISRFNAMGFSIKLVELTEFSKINPDTFDPLSMSGRSANGILNLMA
jgi:hypothetical protein